MTWHNISMLFSRNVLVWNAWPVAPHRPVSTIVLDEIRVLIDPCATAISNIADHRMRRRDAWQVQIVNARRVRSADRKIKHQPACRVIYRVRDRFFFIRCES